MKQGCFLSTKSQQKSPNAQNMGWTCAVSSNLQFTSVICCFQHLNFSCHCLLASEMYVIRCRNQSMTVVSHKMAKKILQLHGSMVMILGMFLMLLRFFSIDKQSDGCKISSGYCSKVPSIWKHRAYRPIPKRKKGKNTRKRGTSDKNDILKHKQTQNTM